MRYGKIVVYLFTVLLLAVIVIFGVEETQWDGTVSLSAVVTSNGHEEEITCWEKEPGEYYLFLPSYADLSQVQLRTHTSNTVRIHDEILTRESTADDFQLNTPYDLSYDSPNGLHHFTLTFVQSGDMPTMYIDVPSGSMDYIHEVKGNEEPGTMRLYTADGQLNHAGNVKSIQGRGNTSWKSDKKPYSLNLSTESDLLGIGAAKRWILLSNAYDFSHLRNKIVYDFAAAAGLRYSPDAQWVDLYLNGYYAGLYLLSERNEVHTDRVSIPEESSFLVSLELLDRMVAKGDPYISTKSGTALRIHHSAVNTDTLLRIWQSAENAMTSETGIDPVTGKHWTELIDVDSWAIKYLIEECFGNVDGCFISQFFYFDGSDETGKIYAGPVWDYDLAMAHPMVWQPENGNQFFANKPPIRENLDCPWFYSLYQNEVFYARIVELYRSIVRPLLEDLLETGIDQYIAQISRAAAMNDVRYSTGDAAACAEEIRSYLIHRQEFLSGVWLENIEYCYVTASIGRWDNPACIAVLPGECLTELPVQENEEQKWHFMDTDEPFDLTQPISEDARIYLKSVSPG